MMATSLVSDITNALSSFSDTPALDASVLVAAILCKPRTWVLAHPELTLTPEQRGELDNALRRLAGGDPLPYVLGRWEFFGLDFEITSDVLIPRPETELLVEKALAWLQASPVHRTIADVGTGSGAIAVSLAANVPDVRVLATDISLRALRVARRNCLKFSVLDRIDLVQCDLIPIPPRPLASDLHFDLICANLPYIPTPKLEGLPIFGREPTLALDGGADGLELIRRLFDIGPEWLAPHGMMLLEIEDTLGIRALNLACDLFSEANIHLHQDLTGRDRLLEITR